MKKTIIILLTLLASNGSFCQGKIQKIELSVEGHARAADYEMTLECNRAITFNAISDNYGFPYTGETIPFSKNEKGKMVPALERKGIFKTKVSKKVYGQINGLVLALKDEFATGQFIENNIHASVAQLKITFKSGEVSTINDTGMKGSDKLIELYALMDSLRFTQNWK